MALTANHKEIKFGVGDVVRVHQRIVDADKTRASIFEGMVIGIKGRDENKMFTVRRIGAQKIGIEQIFPIGSPSIEKIEVQREGVKGVRHAKLYYTRDKSKREIESIYSRNTLKTVKAPKSVKKTSSK